MTTQNKKTTVFLDPRALIEEEITEKTEEETAQEDLENAAKGVAYLIKLLIIKPLIFMLIWNLTIPNLYVSVKPFNYLQTIGIFVMITLLRRTK